jgi:nitrogen fixation protein FixH
MSENQAAGGMSDSPHEPVAPERGQSRAWVWPAIVVSLLGVHATAWIVFSLVAVRDPSFAVEPDHYRKSMAWDATNAQLRANEAIGWVATIETGAVDSPLGERRLACRLADREGRPIAGAEVSVVVFHHARGADRKEARLIEEPPGGVYATRLRLARPGTWECRVKASRGSLTFTQVILHEIAREGGGKSWRP